jgi:uncharacterized protein (DUF697 family)
MLGSALKLTQTAGEMFRGLDRVDFAAARRRALAMRERFPDMDVDAVHTALVHAKCLQAGAIGTVGASAKLIPGVGGLIAGMLGPLADSTVVTTLQAELIAETFALYGVKLPPAAERAAVLTIASTHQGARHAGATLVDALAQQAKKALGKGLAARAMPLAEVVTAMASQVAVTYAIGMRAKALCQLREAQLSDLPDMLRAATAIDERSVMAWTHAVATSAIEVGREAGQRWFERIDALLPDITRITLPRAAEPATPRARAIGRSVPKPKATKAAASSKVTSTGRTSRAPGGKTGRATAPTPRAATQAAKPIAKRTRRKPASD